MSKVIVFTNLTLDGVMQAPGRPDEDLRGGFEYGGWAVPYAAMTQAGDSIATIGAVLTFQEAMACLEVFVSSPKCAGLTITEFNPDHADEDGVLAATFVEGVASALAGTKLPE
jgi:hypothetical protein